MSRKVRLGQTGDPVIVAAAVEGQVLPPKKERVPELVEGPLAKGLDHTAGGDTKAGGAFGVHPSQLHEKGSTPPSESVVLMIGGPASGKGTQAQQLVEEYGLTQISTGDLLRDAKGTPLGDEAATFMKAGKLVPDPIVLELLEKALAKVGTPPKGFILDGFPRTLDQAKSLDALLGRLGAKIDRVILLDVDPATMSSRIEGRRSCKECKAVYHLENKPPKKAGCCDNPTCGENTLMQREDDTKEKVAVRIQTFLDQTAEVVPFYGDLVKKVPGEGRSPAEIFADVQAIVDPASIQAA